MHEWGLTARVMYAPIPAIQTLLERNGLGADVDAMTQRAFAAASCAVAKEILIPIERFNSWSCQPWTSIGASYTLPDDDARRPRRMVATQVL